MSCFEYKREALTFHVYRFMFIVVCRQNVSVICNCIGHLTNWRIGILFSIRHPSFEIRNPQSVITIGQLLLKSYSVLRYIHRRIFHIVFEEWYNTAKPVDITFACSPAEIIDIMMKKAAAVAS